MRPFFALSKLNLSIQTKVSGISDRNPVKLIKFNQNALEVAHEVKAEMERLAKKFPPGIKYQVGFDTTLYVELMAVFVSVAFLPTGQLYKQFALR